MRLLLIRHGETAHNAEQLALGQADVPLTERGRLQARALAEGLAGNEAGNGAPLLTRFGSIAAVYSSPLQRAADTATHVAEALGLAVQTEPGLIEMDVGEVEGQTMAQLRERYPDFLRAWVSDQLADVPMPGGETLRQVQERAWAAVEAIRERHQDETVAAVTHNFVILTLLCRVLGLPLTHFRRFRHDLAAVSVVELTKKRQVVLVLNDRCHLHAEGLAGGSSWGRA